MKRILIKGYYGQDNLGDDFILYSILDTLNHAGKYKVDILASGDANCSGLFSRFKNLKCKMISHTKWRKFSKLWMMLRANRWIIGGGGGYGHLKIRMV